MPLALNTPTSQKAGYVLLTSAMYHVNRMAVTAVLMEARHNIAADMDLPTLLESIDLIEALVYPRFAQY
jgi:hypothetical protein